MPTVLQHDFTTVAVGQSLTSATPSVGGPWSASWQSDPSATVSAWTGDGSGIVVAGSDEGIGAASVQFTTDGVSDVVATFVIGSPRDPYEADFVMSFAVAVSDLDREKSVNLAVSGGPGSYSFEALMFEDDSGMVTDSRIEFDVPITYPTTLQIQVSRSTGNFIVALDGSTVLTGPGFANALYAVTGLEVAVVAGTRIDPSARSVRLTSAEITSTGDVGGGGGGDPPPPPPPPPPPSSTVRVFDDFASPAGNWSVSGAGYAFRTPPVLESVSNLRWVGFIDFAAQDYIRIAGGALELLATAVSDGYKVYLALAPTGATLPTSWSGGLTAPDLSGAFGPQTWQALTVRMPGASGTEGTYGPEGLSLFFAGGVRVRLSDDIFPGGEPDRVTVSRDGTATFGRRGSSTTAVFPITDSMGNPVSSVGDLIGLMVEVSYELTITEFELTFSGSAPSRFWTDLVASYEVI